jgi:hypothetical protein
MGRFESLNIVWPPAGWPQFSAVTRFAGQSLAKDIAKGQILGLHYNIESVPLFKNATKLFQHNITIQGWEYSILNESREYPVLSLSVMDRFDAAMPRESFVADIRAYDTAIPHTRRTVSGAVGAALFLIRHINEGALPDVDRILRSYKLHPLQSPAYTDRPVQETDLRRVFKDKGAALIKGA